MASYYFPLQMSQVRASLSVTLLNMVLWETVFWISNNNFINRDSEGNMFLRRKLFIFWSVAILCLWESGLGDEFPQVAFLQNHDWVWTWLDLQLVSRCSWEFCQFAVHTWNAGGGLLFSHLWICSLNKCIMDTSDVLGAVLSTGGSDRSPPLCPQEAQSLVGGAKMTDHTGKELVVRKMLWV